MWSSRRTSCRKPAPSIYSKTYHLKVYVRSRDPWVWDFSCFLADGIMQQEVASSDLVSQRYFCFVWWMRNSVRRKCHVVMQLNFLLLPRFLTFNGANGPAVHCTWSVSTKWKVRRSTQQTQYKCSRLRLLATSITNKQNHNVIDYMYIESNRDCISHQTSSERKQTLFVWFNV